MRIRQWKSVALAGITFAAAGCQWMLHPIGMFQPLAPGSTMEQLAVDGTRRNYILHLPVRRRGKSRMPLVIVLHGFNGNARAFEQETGFSVLADSGGFVVAYPNGRKGRAHKPRWVADKKSLEDVHFISTLIDTVRARVPIDSTRVYVAGFSNGGNMSYRLGAELGARVAAIGVVSGTFGRRRTDGAIPRDHVPRIPVPAIVFHGREDPTVPYLGDPPDSSGQISVPESLALWADADRCAADPSIDTLHHGDIVRSSFGGCPHGVDVVLYTIIRGVHHWNDAATKNAPVATTDIMWRFFANHPLSAREAGR